MSEPLAKVAWPIGRAALLLAAATGLYWLVPTGLAPDRRLVVAVVFVLGIAGAMALIVWQVRSYRRAAASGHGQLLGLLTAVYASVLFFALTYYVLATGDPNEIAGLNTKLDALYFSLTTVSTVGFGDVHATGQSARGIVSFQIGFDLLFISLAIAAVKAARLPD
ncbi:two pore domain potassium channel family protein [Actinoplanes sp. TBRC 11911]|uniref:potassium channel family protein n=1 Tax=Actinoplanes sp. TBRC 11911 TaxID=2729386 RepID=UPI00145C3BC2|nr:potassium channel family protein [Actinoplanes sp. TBRC 11911]NMO57847.1 two pore domain potassium channel family protein [Actinoplanes sp. TBRC 11911]